MLVLVPSYRRTQSLTQQLCQPWNVVVAGSLTVWSPQLPWTALLGWGDVAVELGWLVRAGVERVVTIVTKHW